MFKKMSLLILAVVLLAGCSPEKGINETKAYFEEARDYVNDVKEFGQTSSTILSSEKSDGQKISELKEQSKKMKQRAEDFNNYQYPSALKLVHRQLMNQNYVLIDSLGALIVTMEAGETSVEKVSEMMRKVKTNEIVEGLSSVIKKSE